MTNDIATIVITSAIFAGRLWSAWEHKKTGKEVNEIKIYFNGEMQRRLDEAREQGRKEALKSKNKKP